MFRRDLNKLPQMVNRMKSPLLKAASLIGGVFAIKGIVSFGKKAVEMASDVNEVQNVVEVSFESMTDKMDKFAKTAIETYGISKLTSKRMASTYTAMARGMGQSLDMATDKALEMTGRMADIASFYNLSMDRTDTIARAVYSGETEPLKQIGVIMTEAQLQTYALSKGYSKLYKNMSAAEKLEIRQNYFLEQTNLAAGDFVRTQDSWANQTRMLSERWKELSATLGTTVLPMLTNVVKMLNTSMGTLQSFANSFNKAFGKSEEKKQNSISAPIDSAVESTENLTEATKSQIKANNQMLGEYDELSIISSQDTSTGSADSLDDIASIAGTTADINTALENTNKTLEKFFDNLKKGNYYEVGKTISDSLRNAVDKINWNKVYKKADKFGTGFAAFLNGLFDGRVVTSISKTITGTLNTAVRALGSFFAELDWNVAGDDFANGINYFFSNFDFARLGKAVSDFRTGVQGLMIRVLQQMDWVKVGESIGEFLKNIDFKQMISNFAVIAKELAGALFTAFISALKEAPMETLLITTIGAMKFTKLGSLMKSKGLTLGKKLNEGFKSSWKSIGGLKFDLADWGATNFAEKLTVGGTVIGTAIAGWNVGKAIADQFEEPLSKAYNAVTDFLGIANETTYKIRNWKDNGITPMEQSLLNLNDRMTEVNRNLGDHKTARDNAFKNSLEDAKTIEVIAGKYLDLYKKVNLTAEEEKQLQGYRDTLIQMAPELQGTLNDTGASYEDLRDKVYEYINSIKDQAIVEAAKGAMTDIARDMLENQKALDSYTEEQKQAMQQELENKEAVRQAYLEAKEARKDYQEYVNSLDDNTDAEEYYNALDKLEELKEKEQKLSEEWVDQVWRVSDTSQAYQDLLEKQDELNGDMEYYANIAGGKMQAVVDSANDMKDGVTSATQEMVNETNEALNGLAYGALDKGKEFGIKLGNGMWKGMNTSGIPSSVLNQMKNSNAYSGMFDVPGLASGAVLPANKPFLALVGDQKNGTNIEAPLDTIKQGVAEVMASMGNTGTQDINLYIDGDKLFSWTREKSNDYKNRYGTSAF